MKTIDLKKIGVPVQVHPGQLIAIGLITLGFMSFTVSTDWQQYARPPVKAAAAQKAAPVLDTADDLLLTEASDINSRALKEMDQRFVDTHFAELEAEFKEVLGEMPPKSVSIKDIPHPANVPPKPVHISWPDFGLQQIADDVQGSIKVDRILIATQKLTVLMQEKQLELQLAEAVQPSEERKEALIKEPLAKDLIDDRLDEEGQTDEKQADSPPQGETLAQLVSPPPSVRIPLQPPRHASRRIAIDPPQPDPLSNPTAPGNEFQQDFMDHGPGHLAEAPRHPRLGMEPKGVPLWLTNAADSSVQAGDGPMIAIILDDLGLNRQRTGRFYDLPGPLTLSYLPYAMNLPSQTQMAKQKGHELMLHMPMEPMDSSHDPGPGALFAKMDDEQIRQTLRKSMARFDGYVGVNNHMGSRFTSDERAISVVMDELADKGLLYVDSVTTAKSKAYETAQTHKVPAIERNVFLDHDPSIEGINKSLARLERVATKQGYAVAIGHPYDTTFKALSDWLPKAQEKGYRLVPISSIMKYHTDHEVEQVASWTNLAN